MHDPLLAVFAVSNAMFAIAWMFREWQFTKERNKLIDRLMAKSLPEYNFEERKKEVLRKKPLPRPFPTDEELATWEHKHKSQVAENNAAAEAAVEGLRRRVSGTPVEANHGS